MKAEVFFNEKVTRNNKKQKMKANKKNVTKNVTIREYSATCKSDWRKNEMKKYVTKIATGILTTGLVLGMTGINSVALHAAEIGEGTVAEAGATDNIETVETVELKFYVRKPGVDKPDGNNTHGDENYIGGIVGNGVKSVYEGIVTKDNAGRVATCDESTVGNLIYKAPENAIYNLELGLNKDDIEKYNLSINWYRLNFGNHIDGEIVYYTVDENGEKVKKTFSSADDITTWVDDNEHVWTKDSETGKAIDLTQKKMDEEKAEEVKKVEETYTPIVIRPRPEEIEVEIEVEKPEENVPTTEIEEEETPLVETPESEIQEEEISEEEADDEEIVDIEDEEVAKSDAPIQKKQSVKETKEIEDMEVALSENPLTGDETPWGWMILAVTSLAGLVGLKFFRK